MAWKPERMSRAGITQMLWRASITWFQIGVHWIGKQESHQLHHFQCSSMIGCQIRVGWRIDSNIQSTQDIFSLFSVYNIQRQQLPTIYDWQKRSLTETTVGNRGININSRRLMITTTVPCRYIDLGIPIPVEKLEKGFVLLCIKSERPRTSPTVTSPTVSNLLDSCPESLVGPLDSTILQLSV